MGESATKRIDPHVHCRDGNQAHKATVREVSELAKTAGIIHICDMPNTDPPILREQDVIARLQLAWDEKPVVGYSLFVGLTSEKAQIEEAVRVVGLYKEVVGLKMYPPLNEQKKVYKVLAELGYRGVLAVHAEKASLFRPELFDPAKPHTHGLAQPEAAEIESVKEQIKFAKETRFQGILYICHITLPESAKLIWEAKKYLDIYSEVTPHHLLLTAGLMEGGGASGLLLKVNPPLRDYPKARGLAEAVRQGMVDCIGTDFAPHLLREKILPPYHSGIADYGLYGMALQFLKNQGMSDQDIENMTYGNIKKIFGEKLAEV